MADPILWKDRDAGEKFFLGMVVLLAMMITAFIVFMAINSIISGKPDWSTISMAALCLIGVASGIRHWSQRNARR